jgi:protein tyrosine phosphatase
MVVYLYLHLSWIFDSVFAQIINHQLQSLFIAGWIGTFCTYAKYILFSAGVGRSGTFIALDALLETAEYQDTIDILDFTHRMR